MSPDFEENRIVRHLLMIMRDGRPTTLEDAVEQLINDLGVDRAKVEEAAAVIRARSEEVKFAQWPKAVVAGNLESWYVGPRAADRNWPALRDLLESEGWDKDALRDLDRSSTKIVAQLPNPAGEGCYQAKGLVLGYVQSGKTTNFTAVIAKAADAGYRLIIVLSGIHDALRRQTQVRLNEQLADLNPDRWHRLTDETDFRPNRNVDAMLTMPHQWVLAVVKKNATRLRALRNWLRGARPEFRAGCPVLIIDDEADQATVNTARPDRQPAVINGLVRDLVNESPRAAYVGYTATPFANVLIDPNIPQDLYPRDFIVDLPRPAAYIGPEAIFGREPLEHDDDEVDDGYDLIRIVEDDELDKLRPTGSAHRHRFEPEVTASLDEALRYFLLSTAARRVRGLGSPHATALIHTSQHVDIHERTAGVVSDHLRALHRGIASGDPQLINDLREQWAEECERVEAGDFQLTPVEWSQIQPVLAQVSGEVVVIVDNSRSPVRLNFERTNPRVIVAVGGNTLSRGLTLEGLSVSFFVRSASAYDTVLQMGRWFGYRSGYADLTRIWMTEEMRTWFRHLATVEQEIRYDVERYEDSHENPTTLGVRIRTHPKLAVTAAAKMQQAVVARMSYSGRRIQTIQFKHRDGRWLEQNLRAARALLDSTRLNQRRTIRGEAVTIIERVDTALIETFIDAYNFHENSRELNSALINKYIRTQLDHGELITFNVAIMGQERGARPDLGDVDLGGGLICGCISRSRIAGDPGYADIKALMSPIDRVIDLDVSLDEMRDPAMSKADIACLRNRPPIGRGDGSGLLLLYPISMHSKPIDPASAPNKPRKSPPRSDLNAVAHVLGVGLVFPEALNDTSTVEYVTADIASMGIQVDLPDDADLPDVEVDEQ